MKKLAVILMAASICCFGRTGVSLAAADNYYSCVREHASQCRYIRDEWESCRDISMDIADMCRSLYPYPKKNHR